MNLYAYVKNNPLRYLDPMGTTSRNNVESPSMFDSIVSSTEDFVSNTLNSVINSTVETYYNVQSTAESIGDTFSNIEQTFDKITSGLSSGVSDVYARKEEIGSDVQRALSGGLNEYRDVRDNAPLPIRYGLQGIMTITEMGVTSGLNTPIAITYDFISGMYFDTSPLASKSSISGFYTGVYIDKSLDTNPLTLDDLKPFPDEKSK